MAKIEMLAGAEFSIDGGLSTIVREAGDEVDGVPQKVADSLAAQGKAEILEADAPEDPADAEIATAVAEIAVLTEDEIRDMDEDALRALLARLDVKVGKRASKKALVEAVVAKKG